MVRAICRVQLKDGKIAEVMMLILGLNETMDQLALANSVRWYGFFLRRALEFEVEDEWKRAKSKRSWK